MSQWRGRLEDNPELESTVDWVTENYQVPVVALLLAFMLWNRLRGWRNFVVDGEVLFGGNDPWYHYRTVTYTVQNWPATMPFDPWTYFPHGNASGQFGTLFDQIVATAALIVGLGSPDQGTIAMTLLVAPAFFGAAAAIPTYVIGRRIGGRIGGVTAVTVLAFSAGTFFARSSVGSSDHHVAEALFQTVGILGVMVAVTVAHREKPIYEQIVERDYASLRPTLLWSVLAGFGITLYLWVWPFGVLLVGIVGVFLLLQMCLEVLRGESPEHTAIAGAITMSVVGVAILPSVQTTAITATDFSLLHPLLAFGVAAGCAFMAWLAREWERRDQSRATYPAAVGGILVVGAVLMAVVLPAQFEYFTDNVLRIFGLGFTTSQTGGTVAEVQPLVDWSRQGLGAGIQQLYSAYGFAVFLGFVGAFVVLGREIWDDRIPAEQLLVVVWAVFITATTFTQARFQYYLVFPVAVLTGYMINVVVGWVDFDFAGDLREIEAYQVLTIGAIVLVVLAPIAPTAVAAGASTSATKNPGAGIQGWDQSLDWMAENTPEEGAFNESGGDLDYYGTYPRQADYDYGPGEYGVLSWWDYGHWITTIGERVPTANPFQQGARMAANFLLSPNESQANDVLAKINEDDAKTRYVTVDWKMANSNGNILLSGSSVPTGGKYFAPTRFYNASNVSESDYYESLYYDSGNSVSSFNYHKQPYYDSTVTRLYRFHGSAADPQPVVVDWEMRQPESGINTRLPMTKPDRNPSAQLRTFPNMSAARAFVQNDTTGTSQVGGIGGLPSERVPAMEHYRLVDATKMDASESRGYRYSQISQAIGAGARVTNVASPDACSTNVTLAQGGGQYLCIPQGTYDTLHQTPQTWTKTFERVPGATVQGTGPANATVSTSVEMTMPDSNETFTYRQQAQTDENGQFTMTLPYSTTGYDEWGTDEGHTNVSVRANSSYQFQTFSQDNGTLYRWNATADVTEGQVVGEDTSPVTVDMDRSEINLNQQPRNSNATGNESGDAPGDATTGTDGDGSGTNETSDTAGSLVPAARD